MYFGKMEPRFEPTRGWLSLFIKWKWQANSINAYHIFHMVFVSNFSFFLRRIWVLQQQRKKYCDNIYFYVPICIVLFDQMGLFIGFEIYLMQTLIYFIIHFYNDGVIRKYIFQEIFRQIFIYSSLQNVVSFYVQHMWHKAPQKWQYFERFVSQSNENLSILSSECN